MHDHQQPTAEPSADALGVLERVRAGWRLVTHRQQLVALALRAEGHARELNGVAAPAAGRVRDRDVDPVAVLGSVCLLLERAVQTPLPTGIDAARPQHRPTTHDDDRFTLRDVAAREPARAPEPAPREPRGARPQPDPTVAQPSAAATPPQTPAASVEPAAGAGTPVPEPSATVRDLIALRDMVIMAGDAPTPPTTDVIRAIARKLGAALEKEGVRLLEEHGRFDYRYQEIIDVRSTTDPGQDEVVCETVRPGYALGERVVRPQQVIVYRLQT